MLERLFWLALAGALGTLARYGLSGMVYKLCGGVFPWGTVFVNVFGCLLFGAIWAASSERNLVSPELRTILLVGFMGAFTTYSTFIYETSQLLSDRELVIGFANMLIQIVVGFGMFYLGLALGRVI